VDQIPDGRSFGDYGGMKPRVCAGLMVIKKRYVNSDEDTVHYDEDPILVGVTGKGNCFLCGKEGPKYKLCKDIYCE
jgi:hypothetical protein